MKILRTREEKRALAAAELRPSSRTVGAFTLTVVNADCLWRWTGCHQCFGGTLDCWVALGYAGGTRSHLMFQ